MAKKVKIEIDSNIEPTIANLKALKKQLRETAAGSEEFNRISKQIRDMDDAIKDASKTSDDFLGYLENASGPLGVLGKGIRQAEQTFSSFNAVLKASVIGIIVAAIGGLVAAFSKSEEAVKKLQPLMIGLEKILGGIFRALEPVLDTFIQLATKALPYVTKGIGAFYSSLYGLFTLIKEAGAGVGKTLQGIFTLNLKAAEEGVKQLAGSLGKAGDAYKASMKRFEDGSKELTKTEKENEEERVKAAKEAADKKKALHDAAVKAREEKEKEAFEEEKRLLQASLDEYEKHLKRRQKLKNEIIPREDLDAQVAKAKKEEEEKLAREKDFQDKVKYLKINSEEEVTAWSKNNQTTALAQEAQAKQESVKNLSALESWLVSDKKAKLDEGVEAAEEALNLMSALVDRNSAAGKAIAVAQAIINTYQGATKALAQGGIAGPVLAAVTIAAGLVNVQKILSTKIPSASGKGSVSNAGAQTPTPAFTGTVNVPAPVIGASQATQSGTLATTIAGAVQAGNSTSRPIQAYVIGDQVTSQQQLDRRISVAAKMGG